MAYASIENLYRNRDILLFRECWALEKVHGTSAHIGTGSDPGKVRIFSGGTKHEDFVKVFSPQTMDWFTNHLGQLTVYGEAYGGKCQGMSATYGSELRFIAFDVKVGEDRWLTVPQAAELALSAGLEFVPYERTSTDLEALNHLRDLPSRLAVIRGIVEPRPREGVVLRPLVEWRNTKGERICAKHKGEAFSERKNTPAVFDPARDKAMTDAQQIADTWVTPMRLDHILGRGTIALDTANMALFIEAMQQDIAREGAGEVVLGKEAHKAIGRATALLVKQKLLQQLSPESS